MAKEIEMRVFSVQHVLVEGSLIIVSTVTNHLRVVRKWINNVSNSLQKVEMNVIGLDAEYTERLLLDLHLHPNHTTFILF